MATALENLAEWHLELRGLVVGGDGNPYRIGTIPEGLGLPEVRTDSVGFALSDGAALSGDQHGERVLRGTITVMPRPRTGQALDRALSALKAAFLRSPVDLDLLLRIGGSEPRRYVGRPTRCEVLLYDPLGAHAEVAWEFRCGRPTALGSMSQVRNSPAVGAVWEGRTYPRRYPLSYGGRLEGGSTGELPVLNAGNYPADWRAEIRGPVTDLVLRHAGLNKAVRWTGTVAEGQVLTIDSATRLVLLDGASAFDRIAGTPEWFSLPPGTSTVLFTAAAGDGPCELTWEPAWM